MATTKELFELANVTFPETPKRVEADFTEIRYERDGLARYLADEYLRTGVVTEWTKTAYAEAKAAYDTYPAVIRPRAHAV